MRVAMEGGSGHILCFHWGIADAQKSSLSFCFSVFSGGHDVSYTTASKILSRVTAKGQPVFLHRSAMHEQILQVPAMEAAGSWVLCLPASCQHDMN